MFWEWWQSPCSLSDATTTARPPAIAIPAERAASLLLRYLRGPSPLNAPLLNCRVWTELIEVRRDLAAWLGKWSGKYARLCAWVEENIEETLTYYRLPLPHHKHMKSTNLLERLNQEIKRRTHVVRIFPSPASCLRLLRALAVETHEEWLESPRYLNMEDLREHKKQQMRAAA